MEAGSVTRSRRPVIAAWVSVAREVGEVVAFSARSLAALGGAARYIAEALRQASILITGSLIVVVGMQLVIGSECALFQGYLLKSYGASGGVGLFSEICGIREMFPYMFGYILAAKVGCGLVAEIGSMRIADEIDALETMGIDPIRYVVGTRLLGAFIALPPMYITSMVFGEVGGHFVAVHQLSLVSTGAFEGGYFGPNHNLGEDILSMTKAALIGMSIFLVGAYYGYTASGGPAGVGANTARSMVVNLVLIHVIGGTLSAVFWGTNGKLSFGG